MLESVTDILKYGYEATGIVTSEIANNASKIKDYTVEKAEQIKDYTVEKTEQIKDYTVEKAGQIKDYTVEKAEQIKDYTVEKAEQIKDYTVEKAGQIKDYTVQKVTEAFEIIKEILSDLIHGIITGCRKAVNNAQNKIAQLVAQFPNLASHLSKDETVVPAEWDGKYLNCNCSDKGCVAEKTNNPVGVKPSGCTAKELPKIFYINGINTTPDQNCTSASKLAKAICANVVPLYNRTEGIGGDLQECVENIKKTGKSPPTRAMVKMLSEKKPGEKVTIYAHSQGGLITQDALARYKIELTEPKPTGKGLSIEDAEKEMSNITVVSMGSAEEGWPKGPNYEQYTNEYDPVPKVIKEAQSTFPEETKTDNAEIDPKKQHKISNPNWNAIESHSIDNTYIEGKGGVKEVKNKNRELCKCK